MKTLKKIKSYLIAVGMLSVGFSLSCSKEDTFNTEDLKVYPASGSGAHNIQLGNVILARNLVVSSVLNTFPVLLTRPYTSDIQVTAVIDTGLLAAYDKEYKTVSPRFDSRAFALSNGGVLHIPAGQTASTDSVRMELSDMALLDKSKNYIVPVRLTTSDPKVPASTNRVMYVKVVFSVIKTALSGVPTNRILAMTIDQTPLGDQVGNSPLIGAATNVGYPSDLQVSIVADKTLITWYNTANKTNLVAFPDNGYKVVPDKVSVAANKTASWEQFRIEIMDTKAFELGKEYLLPLRIKDEGPVAPHEANSIAYIRLTVRRQNIDMKNPKPVGTAIDRSVWKIVSATDPYDSEYAAVNVLDGDNNTNWFYFNGDNEFEIVIDMQDANTLKGLILTPNYLFGPEYNAATVDVMTSMDNRTWIEQGQYKGAEVGGSVSNPDYRNISFVAPVQARYFKLIFDKGSRVYFSGLAEINAVK